MSHDNALASEDEIAASNLAGAFHDDSVAPRSGTSAATTTMGGHASPAPRFSAEFLERVRARQALEPEVADWMETLKKILSSTSAPTRGPHATKFAHFLVPAVLLAALFVYAFQPLS